MAAAAATPSLETSMFSGQLEIERDARQQKREREDVKATAAAPTVYISLNFAHLVESAFRLFIYFRFFVTKLLPPSPPLFLLMHLDN